MICYEHSTLDGSLRFVELKISYNNYFYGFFIEPKLDQGLQYICTYTKIHMQFFTFLFVQYKFILRALWTEIVN